MKTVIACNFPGSLLTFHSASSMNMPVAIRFHTAVPYVNNSLFSIFLNITKMPLHIKMVTKHRSVKFLSLDLCTLEADI